MSDAQARQAALTQLDALLLLAESGPLDARSCLHVTELCALAPGRMRRAVAALSRQRDAAAVDALLGLPAGTRGVIEGVFGALRRGVTRGDPERGPLPHMLALEFRSSSSRSFPQLLARASAAFGSELERIRVGNKLHYRFTLSERTSEDALRGLSARARSAEFDLLALHQDLARLRGVRLWLNGWCFDEHSTLRPPARAALLRAWFEWAREQGEAASKSKPGHPGS